MTTGKNAILAVDHSLRPLGFIRHKSVWNRRSGGVVDVVDIQVSKGGESVTINAGVLDPDVHEMLWNAPAPATVEEPHCTVGTRIGALIDGIGGRDIWWKLADGATCDRLANAAIDHALPFIDRMRSRPAMVQWLTDTGVAGKKYPPPIINLAILRALTGETACACALLDRVRGNAPGGWAERAGEVARRLGCPV